MYGLDLPRQLSIVRIFTFSNGKTEQVKSVVLVQTIKDLKKAAIYKDTKFEWFMYDAGQIPVDYVLHYSEMADYKWINYSADEYEYIATPPIQPSKCSCGSRITYNVDDDSPIHSFSCDVRKR